MFASSLASAAAAAACALLLLRAVLSLNSLLHLLSRFWRFLDDATQSHQIYKIPQYHLSVDGGGGHQQQNSLYRKALAYVSSLPSVEDSDGAHILSSGRKPNDFSLQPDPARSLVRDSFRGARLSWSLHPAGCLHLRLRRHDRHRILRPYLQHVETVADELDLRRKDIRLFTNNSSTSSWNSVPFTHPSTLDTVAMDPDLKTRVKSDLELFLKGRAYYARLGRVWKRSYLLHGPPGTGKSTFVAAMAKFISYDIYELDLSRVHHHDPDLKSLLLQTTPRSLILVEDLDRYLSVGNSREQQVLTSMLSFMDGVFSCCGEERVMVFTMSSTAAAKDVVDPALLRPGRLDVHIHFPLCDFAGFKTLASSYLGLKDHKLYPQVEEGFQSGAKLSPAEIGEIMIANRGSPSRAIKTVISALQQSSSAGRALSESGSVKGGSLSNNQIEEFMDGCGARGGFGFGKDTTVREFKKLYGLIRRSGSRREGTLSVEMAAAAAAAAAGAAGHTNGLEKAGP